MTVSTFFVDSGGGPDHVGDAYAPNQVIAYLNQTTSGWVGRNAKNAAETNLFLRFLFDAITLGSRINGANLGWRTSVAATGSGNFRLGVLEEDGTWEENGFATTTQATPGYFNASQLPHASLNNSTAIIAGRIILDLYAGPNFAFGGLGADVDLTAGEGIGGEDFTTTLLQTMVSGVRNITNKTAIGITLDSQNVGNDDNRMRIYLTESGGAERPFLVIDWDENPPVFTSSPTLVGANGAPYAYTAVADPWSLGDQTAGNFLGVTYSLEVNPSGASIHPTTGVITWTPFNQAGVHDFTIRATNDGGLVVDQVFQVTVPDTSPTITSTPPGDPNVFVTCDWGDDLGGGLFGYQATADQVVEWDVIPDLLLIGPGFNNPNSDDVSGHVFWKPNQAMAHLSFLITGDLVATNLTTGESDSQAVLFQMVPTVPPSIVSVPDTEVESEGTYAYLILADGNADACQSIGAVEQIAGDITLPPGAVLNPPPGGSPANAIGQIDWVPTLAQSNQVFSFEINLSYAGLTNQDFVKATQSWTVGVGAVGDMVVDGAIVAEATAQAVTAEASGQALAVEASAQKLTASGASRTITAEGEAQSLSATFVVRRITAESD